MNFITCKKSMSNEVRITQATLHEIDRVSKQKYYSPYSGGKLDSGSNSLDSESKYFLIALRSFSK